MTPAIVNIAACTKWYGRVIGVSDINWQFGGGIVGMLGTNGAGKSTLMKMLVGLVQPSRGSLDVFGRSPFLDPDVRCRIGYAPEHDQMWDGLTAIELVTILAELTGMAKGAAKRAADAALASVGLVEDRDRRVGELSKGARQRVKLATAIAHDPDLLVLDEPFTGIDPIARRDIIAGIRALADAGKTIVVSSHVLQEVEALTSEIVVLSRGRIVAAGSVLEIRRELDRDPHRVRIDCDHPRIAAALLVRCEKVTQVTVERGAVIVATTDLDQLYAEVASCAKERRFVVGALKTIDYDLESIFNYLTCDANGHE